MAPERVCLVRVGEFFEAFGADAVHLIEHCGLNPMGARARAGCPLGHRQLPRDPTTAGVVQGRLVFGQELNVSASGVFASKDSN